MKNKIFTIVLLFSWVSLVAQKTEITPYIDFITQNQTDPVEYVFELFEKYDILILGERDHRDITQYELIQQIISDTRFTEKVGNIFTEVGVNNRTKWANKVLKDGYPAQEDFEKELCRLYREIDFSLIWEKYNYWMLLSSIYKVNKDLPIESKISLYMTDVPFDWYKIKTPKQYKKFYAKMNKDRWERDRIMGENFIKEYEKIIKDKKQSRKKALVILNRPHSYQTYEVRTRDRHVRSAASYIFSAYPGKVANVMVNWVEYEESDENYLASKGKWDAAFLYLNNPSIGFNLEGSPFGEDRFDCKPYPYPNKKFKEVYTGFIFYKPIKEWVIQAGIPGFVDSLFMDEYMRRVRIIGYPEDLMINYADSFSNVISVPFKDYPQEIDEWINYWLE